MILPLRSQRAAVWTVAVNVRRWFPASGILWSSDGLIITANHVIEREDAIHVTLYGREQTEACLIGRDLGADLALLQSERATEGPELAPANEIRVGHVVMALGASGSV